jgi:uncharacterized ferritin-like protein (DUF455 family)
MIHTPSSSFFNRILEALMMPSAETKCQYVDALATEYLVDGLSYDDQQAYAALQMSSKQRHPWSHPDDIEVHAIPKAGLPLHLIETTGGHVPHRGMGQAIGRAHMLHAIAHIEFNAINLALDAIWRFRTMPIMYALDWLKVAHDEAIHFRLLQTRIRSYGHDYGDFPTHGGLWEMATRTDHDVLVRMALVPRVMEARGLDVTPSIIHKFQSASDHETAQVLQRIYQDEIIHVQLGNRWFNALCQDQLLEPMATFKILLNAYGRNVLKAPFNKAGRHLAGFTEYELQLIEDVAIQFQQQPKMT